MKMLSWTPGASSSNSAMGAVSPFSGSTQAPMKPTMLGWVT
eukprot:CAMPEP_0180428462 /NCGR_PEP_ID=MMETSP1036_2-20121128/6846_1 /TAXON_ID=632150 /ORGANISM="Azadinium spinosum, Strain 3D9" /LENGTH=40 /DNA_ID= /DNA_START= /DNA_END= /DNA_ORIENTATION=